MVNVLGLGDNVCDIYLHTGYMYPGGQALNFAVYSSKLGAKADYMGVFGNDIIATHIKNVLDIEGVGRSHCHEYPGENGYALVSLIHGDRVFKGSNQGGILRKHQLHLSKKDLVYLSSFDLIHTSNNSHSDHLLPILNNLPPIISYDFSYHWNDEERVKRVCPYIDFGFISCSNLNKEQTQAECQRLNNLGFTFVIATRGNKEVIFFDGTRFYFQLPKIIQPIDTMGAGDSFAAAMIISMLNRPEQQDEKHFGRELFREDSIVNALENAAIFASQTCLTNGAFGYGIAVPDIFLDQIRRKYINA